MADSGLDIEQEILHLFLQMALYECTLSDEVVNCITSGNFITTSIIDKDIF